MIDRRTFLQSAMLLPALRPFQTKRVDGRRRVIVIGAGLAGLCAFYELERAGHEVVLLEARTRPGGRVFTMREPFSDGLYAEAGAARIQDTHEFTMRYVERFGLALDPFFPNVGNRVTYVGGRRLVGPPGLVDLTQVPLPFTEKERRDGLGQSLMKYLFAHLPHLGDPAASDWPSRDLTDLETSTADFCRRQGASSAMLKMVALGPDLDGMSALQFLTTIERHDGSSRQLGSPMGHYAVGKPVTNLLILAGCVLNNIPLEHAIHMDAASGGTTWPHLGIFLPLRLEHRLSFGAIRDRHQYRVVDFIRYLQTDARIAGHVSRPELILRKNHSLRISRGQIELPVA